MVLLLTQAEANLRSLGCGEKLQLGSAAWQMGSWLGLNSWMAPKEGFLKATLWVRVGAIFWLLGSKLTR